MSPAMSPEVALTSAVCAVVSTCVITNRPEWSFTSTVSPALGAYSFDLPCPQFPTGRTRALPLWISCAFDKPTFVMQRCLPVATKKKKGDTMTRCVPGRDGLSSIPLGPSSLQLYAKSCTRGEAKELPSSASASESTSPNENRRVCRRHNSGRSGWILRKWVCNRSAYIYERGC